MPPRRDNSTNAISALICVRDDKRLSSSLLRALLVLAAVPEDGSSRTHAQVAATCQIGKTTAYRYLKTWSRIGVLEHDSRRGGFTRVPGALEAWPQAVPCSDE